MDRAITDLSVSERLAIYDYVTAQSRNDIKIPLEELQMASNENLNTSTKEKSRLEVLAEERDYKRRRQSYRAKNVHITKKSYTEILRDVIHSHTEALQTQQIEENVESEIAAQVEIARNNKKNHRKRSRSRSKNSYHRESSDHHKKQKSSHSKDSDNYSKSSHKDKEKKHKHKSKKKSHKHDRHRHRTSDS